MNNVEPHIFANKIFSEHYTTIQEAVSDLEIESKFRSLGDEIIVSVLAKRHSMLTIKKLIEENPDIDYYKQVKFHLEDI